MGGDLNLKKSWHVNLLSNQKKVWESEQAALAERKKTAERVEELRKERAEEEIQRRLEAAGGQKRVDRVDWMYQGPTDGGGMPDAEKESFLLGKRRIDNILKQHDDSKKLEKNTSQESLVLSQQPLGARDMASKIRDDPLLAIKQKEQMAYQALLNDPIKRRQLLASMGIVDEPISKEREDKQHRRKHRHRHRRHEDGADEERRHRRRRSVSDERSRSRKRSRSDDGERHSQSRRDSRDRQRNLSYENNRDSRSSYKRERSRSRTPKREDTGDNERQRYRRRDDGDSHSHRESHGTGRPRYRNHEQNSGAGRDSNGSNEAALERARKLAAMQDAASHLDKDRERRLVEIEAKERLERESDNRAREQESRYGGRSFANNLQHKASERGLAERIGRSKHALQKEDN